MLLGLPDRIRIRYSHKNSKKNLDFYCFVSFYDFLSLKNYVNGPMFGIHPDPYVFGPPGSASGSVSHAKIVRKTLISTAL
jgi:hypothetical protein